MFLKNNQVLLIGKVLEGPVFSHITAGENIYVAKIEVDRLSGQRDVLPLQIPESLLSGTDFGGLAGRIVRVSGEYHSRNQSDVYGNHLILTVWVCDLSFHEGTVACSENNQIQLRGFLCKKPVSRTTPLGRKIADLLIAVNREHGQSDYIPCIAWGATAETASGLDIGASVSVEGRLQSRTYIKRFNERDHEERVAYEVSCSKLWEGSDCG